MAERTELRNSLRELKKLVTALPEYVVDSSKNAPAWFRPLFDCVADSELLEENPTVWEEVHCRLESLEACTSWTAGGKAGLLCLWKVLDFYGCSHLSGEGHEIVSKTWSDKITVAVKNLQRQLAGEGIISATTEPSRLSSPSLPSIPVERCLTASTSLPKEDLSSPIPSGSQAPPRLQIELSNLPTAIPSVSTSYLPPRNPLSGTQTPPDRSQPSAINETIEAASRPESSDPESELSDLESSSSVASDDGLVVVNGSPSNQEADNRLKGKGKAGEQSKHTGANSSGSSRHRSAGPSPNVKPKPGGKFVTAGRQLPQPDDRKSTRLSTHDRIRITLPFFSNLDLTYFENPWPNRDLSFTRVDMGGSTIASVDIGTSSASNRRISIRNGANIAPMQPGECGVFFSNLENRYKLRAMKDFGVFVGMNQNDWHYRGQYEVMAWGYTTPEQTKNMSAARKAEVQKVLEGHHMITKGWCSDKSSNWNFTSRTPEAAVEELDRGGGTSARMIYTVLRCTGFNQEYYDIWDAKRQARLKKGARGGKEKVASNAKGNPKRKQEDEDYSPRTSSKRRFVE